jgi:circadian clock protein KaiC
VDSAAAFSGETMSSGLPGFGALLGGGVERGTSLLLAAPAGVGKSSLATQYALAALQRGEDAAMRCRGLGMELDPHLETGRLTIEQVNASELSPGHFAYNVRQRTEGNRKGVVVIDSLNGWWITRSRPSSSAISPIPWCYCDISSFTAPCAKLFP